MMQHFGFKYPWLLLNIVWVALLCYCLLKSNKPQQTLLFPTEGVANLPKAQPYYWPTILRYLSITMLIVAIARPCMIIENKKVQSSGIDLYLALDLSSSMLAPDFSINQFQNVQRIQAAKVVLENFIKKRKNDRLGLVAFARYPYLISPLTLNHKWLLKNLERLNAGLIEDGTAIGSAITMCINRLKPLEAKSRVIVLLTDGVNNFGAVSPLMAAEVAQNFNTKIYTVMVGNDQFFPVDEQMLVQVAEKTGGRFYRAYDISTLEAIYQEINQLEKSKTTLEGYTHFTELFPYCLLLALLILLSEGFLRTTKYRVLP